MQISQGTLLPEESKLLSNQIGALVNHVSSVAQPSPAKRPSNFEALEDLILRNKGEVFDDRPPELDPVC